MKNHIQLACIVALSIAVGSLGTLALQTHEARAQAPAFTRCFFADFGGHADGDNPEHMRNAQGGIAIPPGWTVAPGSGGDFFGVILCR